MEAEKVELKYREGVMFPWRIVHAGTDECVQRGGESLAYKSEWEAHRGIDEFGLKLVPYSRN